MKQARYDFKPLVLALFAAGVLTACGGGGGSETPTTPQGNNQPPTTTPPTTTPPTTTPPTTTPPTTTPPTTTPPTTTPPTTSGPEPVSGGSTTMTCADGPTVQCSGSTILRSDNGVALTSSGVQAYGRSTNDLATPIVVKTGAIGFGLTSGGTAEMRVSKDATSVPTSPAVLLRNLGLSWDGVKERPQIIETFRTTQGRVQLDSEGRLTSGALPASSNTGFYDFVTLGVNATQGNYANNVYFPRTPSDVRCPGGGTGCPSTETSGVSYIAGDWRTGGSIPDLAEAVRLHSDGDIHAGDGVPGDGHSGVPFPGSKGYRGLTHWSLQYANLGAWLTQDTVEMAEWTSGPGDNEHNKNRRGVLAYGAVTDPAAVPTTGTASYSGMVYGWYTADPAKDPDVFRGNATITVNFATREVTVAFTDTVINDATGAPVPLGITANTLMGAASTNVANYLTGSVAGTLAGGVSGRYFGPVVTTGASGSGPAEVGGAFQLSNASGAAAVGGFIARKQ